MGSFAQIFFIGGAGTGYFLYFLLYFRKVAKRRNKPGDRATFWVMFAMVFAGISAINGFQFWAYNLFRFDYDLGGPLPYVFDYLAGLVVGIAAGSLLFWLTEYLIKVLVLSRKSKEK